MTDDKKQRAGICQRASAAYGRRQRESDSAFYYVYSDGTSASNGYPSSSGSRITRIVQKNQGCSEITVATLNYDSASI